MHAERAPVGAAVDAHVGAARASAPSETACAPSTRGRPRRAARAKSGCSAWPCDGRRSRCRPRGRPTPSATAARHARPAAAGRSCTARSARGTASSVRTARPSCARTPSRRRGVLVDVVAEEQHQVEVCVGDVAPGGVVAVVVALATRDREAQAVARIGRRRGARAAHRAALAQRLKRYQYQRPGSSPAARRARCARRLERGSMPRAAMSREAFVARQLPTHAALRRQVRAGEARPQHDRRRGAGGRTRRRARSAARRRRAAWRTNGGRPSVAPSARQWRREASLARASCHAAVRGARFIPHRARPRWRCAGYHRAPR